MSNEVGPGSETVVSSLHYGPVAASTPTIIAGQ